MTLRNVRKCARIIICAGRGRKGGDGILRQRKARGCGRLVGGC